MLSQAGVLYELHELHEERRLTSAHSRGLPLAIRWRGGVPSIQPELKVRLEPTQALRQL
jgi:hypothetical protein